MTFLTAGFINGSRVPAAILRRLAWAATSGQTGVVQSPDLKVTQTGTASTSIVVGSGAAVINSTFTNAKSESYLVANDSAVTVPVPANGSGATVIQHVYLAVRDPDQAGQVTPPDPLTNSYTDVVVSQSFPSAQAYIWLADISMAAGVSVVTAAMITDKRVLPRPLSETLKKMMFPASTVTMSKTAYTSWPLSNFAITVPPWATLLQVQVTVNGVAYTGGTAAVGGVRVTYHNSVAQNGIIMADAAGRQTISVVGEFSIPSGDRGQLRYIGLQGYQTAGSGSFSQDYQSQVILEWTFMERAV